VKATRNGFDPAAHVFSFHFCFWFETAISVYVCVISIIRRTGNALQDIHFALLHEKKRAYRRNAVREYLVWLVHEQRIEWWEWREGDYVSLPAENGLIKSRVFPGLLLDATALVNGRSAEVLAQLQRGLATDDHTAFAAHTKSRLGG
jgi:hypothetical protein